ncbi:hypothetical protein JTE90_026149 [Oedothorax gibbosus]|uniref:Uncharacterized protein n=1 Tax=Oedothorax gibbosus TaxID=931172 RepID=A0AAV6V172_9ARAC|nr:hypothetical protein JTE90_026149 [Oedothorax gibbosus]
MQPKGAASKNTMTHLDPEVYFAIDGLEAGTVSAPQYMGRPYRSASIPNLDLLPSHINLVGAEVEMVNFKNREGRIREALKPIMRT